MKERIMKHYAITLDVPGSPEREQISVNARGPLRLLNYTAGVIQEELGGLPDETEVSVSIFRYDSVGTREAGTKVLQFAGDADDAAGLVKSKVLKERRAATDASSADEAANSTNATE